MSLTNRDLKRIEQRIDQKLDVFHKKLLVDIIANFVSRTEFHALEKKVDDIADRLIVLQDTVVSMHQMMEYYMPFQKKQIDSNTSRIMKIENHIGF